VVGTAATRSADARASAPGSHFGNAGQRQGVFAAQLAKLLRVAALDGAAGVGRGTRSGATTASQTAGGAGH